MEDTVCTRCGSTKTWLENQLVFCACFSHWKLSYRDEIYSRMEQICPWVISLCHTCALANYKESLTKTKDNCYFFMTKRAPLSLFSGIGAALIMILVVGSFGGATGVAGALLLAYLVGCGIAVAIAVIGFPISLIMFLKSSNKLNMISSSAYHLSESEKVKLIYNEGDKILTSIQTKSRNYYGDYALPERRSWSKPPFDDFRLISDARRINWSFEIVTANKIIECVNNILSMSTITVNHQLYSLCDDFIDQLYRTNQIEEKKYSKLKSKITNKKEESRRDKDEIENKVLNELLSDIISEGSERFGKYGGFTEPGVTIPKFINALNHLDRNFQEAAMDALKYVSGEDFGMDENRWREWWKENRNKKKVYKRLRTMYPNNINYQ